MLKNKLFLALLLLGAISPAGLSAKTVETQKSVIAGNCEDHLTCPRNFTGQELHRILMQVKNIWTQYNYGQLRSAYNHGSLTIELYSHPNLNPAYNWVRVVYGGLEVCVILDPA